MAAMTINTTMMALWSYLSCANIIYIVGLLSIVTFLVDNFKSLVFMVKAIMEPYFQPERRQTLAEKYGKWAVVTGATDGIGREYCKELARVGINIVLISRTEAKLVATANEIETMFKVKTKWIVADFAKGRAVYEHIEKELDGITVGILVNNVGKMYDYPDALDAVPTDILWDLININVGAITMMSRMLVPAMKRNRRGAVVNISSGSELQPLPLMAAYSATKRYVKCLSLAMERELAEFNVTVQCVTPLFLVTKMNQYSERVMRGGLFVPSVQNFTRSAVFTLGKSNETTGYWSHGIQYFFMKLSPEWLRIRMSYEFTKVLRREYFKKQATEQGSIGARSPVHSDEKR